MLGWPTYLPWLKPHGPGMLCVGARGRFPSNAAAMLAQDAAPCHAQHWHVLPPTCCRPLPCLGAHHCRTFTERFSRHVEKLPTRAFLAPLDINEEVGSGLRLVCPSALHYRP